MNLSINKLLIGFLFVFSIILIPAGVAKANVYTASCSRENDYIYNDFDEWFNFSLNVSVSPSMPLPMSLTASGGVSSNVNGCDNDIVVYVHPDQDGADRTLFSGSLLSPLSGERIFSFNTGGYHYIDFTVNLSAKKNQNYFIFNGWTYHDMLPLPPPPAATVDFQVEKSGVGTWVKNLNIFSGEKARLKWWPENATSCVCTYSGGSCGTGSKDNEWNYSQEITLNSTTTFYVHCEP